MKDINKRSICEGMKLDSYVLSTQTTVQSKIGNMLHLAIIVEKKNQ